MFGSIGGGEILLILALALLLFGPRKLPGIGKSLGKTLAEFRRATHDLKHSLEQEVNLEEVREARRGLESAGSEIRDAVSASNPLGIARGALEPEDDPDDTTDTAEGPTTPEARKAPEPPEAAEAPEANDEQSAERP